MQHIPEDLYRQVVSLVPIVCVDMVPARLSERGWQIGIITRATGPEAGKPAILGGRINHDETIENAIFRHLKKDWGILRYRLVANNTITQPFYVQQYFHQASAKPPFGYDPTKHAVTLTYIIDINEEPQPKNEAADFRWISNSEVPAEAAYNQHLVMRLAFEYLQKQ